MIIFAELFMTGTQHAPFNAAMLVAFQEAFPMQAIEVHTSKQHFEEICALQSNLSVISLKQRHVVPNKIGSKRTWLKKFFNEAIQLFRVLKRAKHQQATLVYFTFLSPFGQLLVNYYLKALRYKRPVWITLHGLEILQKEKQRKTIDKLYATCLRYALRKVLPNKRYMALEATVVDYLVKHQFVESHSIFYIPHPYIFKHATGVSANANKPIVFAHFGSARLDKNSSLFFELASHFRSAIRAGKVVFEVIGPVLPEIQHAVNSWVTFTTDVEMLPRATYEQACARAHYAVFCYQANQYELTSSGAVLDAIAFSKPILALRSPSLQHLFSITTQPPGQLFDDVETLCQGIQLIVDQPHFPITDYQTTFLALQAYHGIPQVASLLRTAMYQQTTIGL